MRAQRDKASPYENGKSVAVGGQSILVGVSYMGKLPCRRASAIVKDVVTCLSLSPVGSPVVRRYPTQDGKGGYGYTLFQPFTESFLVWDGWDVPAGGFIVLLSCKLFWLSDLLRLLRERGLSVVDVTWKELTYASFDMLRHR